MVTGFEESYIILFRELKQREEALAEEAAFLTNEQMLIYTILGANKNIFENNENSGKREIFQGWIYDITERKRIEEVVKNTTMPELKKFTTELRTTSG